MPNSRRWGITTVAVWAILFPYINPAPILRVDTQPWALLLSIAAFVVCWRKIRLEPIHLGALSLFALVALMCFLDVGDFSAVRYALGYLSLFVISVVVSHASRTELPAMLRSIDASLVIWTIVGLFQRFVSRGAFDWLISDARTNAIRGVIGLAPEPTFYASTILLMLLWRSLFGLRAWHVAIGLIVTFVLASSSQIALVLVIALAVFVLTSLVRPRFFVPAAATVIGAGAITWVFALLLPTSRLGSLLNLLIRHPRLALMDESINERAVQVFASSASIYRNMFLPAGLDSEIWINYVNQVRKDFPGIFWVPQFSDRIMSGFGSIIYQTGFFSLFLFVAIYISIVDWRQDWQFKTIWATLFSLLLFTAIPLAHPMIGAILGSLSYRATNRFSVGRSAILQ